MLNDLLKIAFPSNCTTCNSSLLKGEKHLCTSCLFHIPKGDKELTVNSETGKLLCNSPNFKGSTHLFFFDKEAKTQKILHQLKYKSNPDFGIYLGELIGADFNQNLKNIDYIIPVPLHPKKLYQRGFNQSELLANGIRNLTNLDVLTNILIRNRHTETQTKKGKAERIKNIQGAFEIKNQEILKHKKILLIDDVITTGSTINECIKELDKIDGISIYVISLAVASY